MAEPMILRANALTTLDRLKSFLCIPADEEDSERDAALTQLINAASAWLETKLGRKLGRQTYDEPHFGTGTQRLVLNQYPIISIRHIRDNRTGAEITGYDFVEEGEIGVVYREDGWTYYGHIGGLSYDYVYVLPKDATEDDPCTLPADLEALIWNMIAQQWALLENDAAGLSAFSISDVSWTFDKNLSQTWQDVISLYRKW